MSGDRADKRDDVEVAHATTVGAPASPASDRAEVTVTATAVATPKLANVELPPVLATRYELKRVIGAGGMGLVYEALDLNLHRHVALKVLKLAPTKPEERAEAVNRLVREARAMAALSHKNVVTVHDVGYHEDQVYVAMQFVDGATLRQWLKEKRSTQEILHVLYEAGSGLAAAHAARIIHRDFKPDNVLVSQRRTVRVTDFGLARRSDGLIEPQGITPDRVSAPGANLDREAVDVTSVTRSGAIVGTPAYMAPEQAQGQPCDARADQFSFCVTAWEALFGGRPFPGKNWSEIYSAVQKQQIDLPPLDYRKAPRSIQKALRRGMAVDPADRFPSMVELLDVFEDALRAPARRRFIALGVLAALAVVAAVIITRNVGDRDDAPAERRDVVATPQPPPPTSTLTIPDTSRRNIQIAIRKRDTEPDPDPEPVKSQVPPGKKPHATAPPRTPPRQVTEAEQTTPAQATPEPPRDARLDGLRAQHAALDGEYGRRELLATDLPDTYRIAKQAMQVALDGNDADRASIELANARAAIAGVKIDRAFVDAKVQRINAHIPKARQSEFAARLGEVLRHFNDDDFVSANRKINSIARDLAK